MCVFIFQGLYIGLFHGSQKQGDEIAPNHNRSLGMYEKEFGFQPVKISLINKVKIVIAVFALNSWWCFYFYVVIDIQSSEKH